LLFRTKRLTASGEMSMVVNQKLQFPMSNHERNIEQTFTSVHYGRKILALQMTSVLIHLISFRKLTIVALITGVFNSVLSLLVQLSVD
jgi:energy-converting hydrogenase Eha subunit A